jgi:hypothetical protein
MLRKKNNNNRPGSAYLASMTLISFLKPCFSTFLTGIIYLEIQYGIVLFISLYRFDFFSYGVMAGKADACAGC